MPISGGETIPRFHNGTTQGPDLTVVAANLVSGQLSPALSFTTEPLPLTFRRWLGVLGTLSGVVSGDLVAVSGIQHEMALRVAQLETVGTDSALEIVAANALLTASGEFNAG